MRYLLIYYTGTHNTRYLVNKLKQRLELDFNEVDTLEIKCDTKPIDMIILVYHILFTDLMHQCHLINI